MVTTPFRVAVIGAGPAGLAVSTLLARISRCQVTLFDRSPELRPVGSGLLMQPTGMFVLQKMGLDEETLQRGAIISRLYGTTTASRPVLDLQYKDLGPGSFGVGMHRGALWDILRKELQHVDLQQVVSGVSVHRVVGEDEDQVFVVGDRGSREDQEIFGPFHLVVAADGSRSVLRDSFPLLKSAKIYPWGALWTVCGNTMDTPAMHTLRQVYHGSSKMIGMLPVGNPDLDTTTASEQGPLASFFWSLPLLKYHDWVQTPLHHWKDEVISLWPELEPVVTPLMRDQLQLAVYRDVRLKSWHGASLGKSSPWSKVVFIGDAAHGMSPQMGQGTNLALLDAWALAENVRDFVETHSLCSILEKLCDQRKKHTWYYQFWSRWMTPLFQSHSVVGASLRDWTFPPMQRIPILRAEMLQALAGLRQGVWGRFPDAYHNVDALPGDTAKEKKLGA